jgi:hypothetical protein
VSNSFPSHTSKLGLINCLPLGILFFFANYFSCVKQPDTLAYLSKLQPDERTALFISRNLRETTTLVPSSYFNKTFFQQHGILPEWQNQFVTMYEKLRKDLELVRYDFQKNTNLHYFLLNRYVEHSQDSVGNIDSIKYLASPRNPVFMGFSLISENMPNWQSIGDPVYIRSLARSFNVKPWEIYEGIWLCLKNNKPLVFQAVALIINENLKDSKSASPEFFFRNILIPYLTYLCKGIAIYPPIEQAIFNKFDQAFSDQDNQSTLKTFSGMFKNYLIGEPLDVKYKNKLNSVLAKHGFRLFIQRKNCVGYRILKTNIPIEKNGIGKIVFLEKVSISLSMAYLGLSTMDEKDVVLSIDDIREYVDDIAYSLKSHEPFFHFSKSGAGIWDEMKTGISLDSADNLCNDLLRKEFSGLPESRINRKFVQQFAVHEVKHKWDEIISPDTSWYNVDCEISAMFTEIVYGGNTRFALLNTLFRCQNFYNNINQNDIRDTLRPIIKKCWYLVQNVKNGSADTTQVKEKIKEMYGQYVLFRGGKLPPLDDYNREIVVPCLGKIPEIYNTLSN